MNCLIEAIHVSTNKTSFIAEITTIKALSYLFIQALFHQIVEGIWKIYPEVLGACTYVVSPACTVSTNQYRHGK